MIISLVFITHEYKYIHFQWQSSLLPTFIHYFVKLLKILGLENSSHVFFTIFAYWCQFLRITVKMHILGGSSTAASLGITES